MTVFIVISVVSRFYIHLTFYSNFVFISVLVVNGLTSQLIYFRGNFFLFIFVLAYKNAKLLYLTYFFNIRVLEMKQNCTLQLSVLKIIGN
jgi:hypothetical protein